MMEECSFRFAEEKDAAKVLYFIKTLAEYENMSNEVVCDEELLKETIFNKKGAEVLFVTLDGKEIGMALFFHNFSTFWEEAVFILRMLLSLKNTEAEGLERLFSRNWQGLPKKENAADLSGGAWIGISPA